MLTLFGKFSSKHYFVFKYLNGIAFISSMSYWKDDDSKAVFVINVAVRHV